MFQTAYLPFLIFFFTECKQSAFLYNGSCYEEKCPKGSYLQSQEEAALTQKQLVLKGKKRSHEEVVSNSSKYSSLDNILPISVTSSNQERAIMKPQIQKICEICHSTCSQCNDGGEGDCTECQAGLALITPSSNSTTGVCVSPAAIGDESLIRNLNQHVVFTSVMIILLLVVLSGVLFFLFRKQTVSKLRDSYAYDRVESSAAASAYDEEVLDDAFLTYKQLKSKYMDFHDDDPDHGPSEENDQSV